MSLPDELLQSLARRSRYGGVVTLLGTVVVAGTLGAAAWQLHGLETRKAQLNADIAQLSAQKAALSVKSDAQQDVIAKAELKIAAGETPAAAKVLAAAPPPATVVKRVYFQARSADQTALFKGCAGGLVAKGYRVPKLEMVPDTGPQRTSIRYFRPEDRDEAQQLANDLGSCAGTDFKVSAISGYASSANVKPHQFEVWFAPDLHPAAPLQPVVQAVNPRLEVQQAAPYAQAKLPPVQQQVIPAQAQQQKAR